MRGFINCGDIGVAVVGEFFAISNASSAAVELVHFVDLGIATPGQLYYRNWHMHRFGQSVVVLYCC